MEYVVTGVRLTLGNAKFRRYLIKPLFWSILIYLVISITASTLLMGPISNKLMDLGLNESWSPWVARVAVFLIWGFVAGPIFFGINGLLSSLLWEDLSLKIEEHVFGSAPAGRTSLARGLADSAARLPITAGVSILSFFVGLTPLFWLNAWPVGWLSLYDFSAPAYARRGLYYPRQKSLSRQLPKSREFAITAGAISLIPIFGLICLPGLIAGATILVRKGETSSAPTLT